MIDIRVITAFPDNPNDRLRTLSDLKIYEKEGFNISLSHNSMGTIHCQSDIDHEFAKVGMAHKAFEAQKEGVNAIVIESMGDTALSACREATTIPVIGMSDIGMRVAQMLGRKFGTLTVGSWHAFYLEKLMKRYGVIDSYAGFEDLKLQPFFLDNQNENDLEKLIENASLNLIYNKNVDVILLGGSYFIGYSQKLKQKLLARKIDVPIIDPLPLAIYFARTLVESGIYHSKIQYKLPNSTEVIGFSDFQNSIIQQS